MGKAKVLQYPTDKLPTLREKITEFVKDSIISGRLKPGERVPEQEIAENFGISRTPIREAFRQLESEGFITVTPRKGAVVSSITAKDVGEFYTIKSILEGHAAKVACRKMSDRDIKKLETLNEQMLKCSEKGDVKGFFNLDNQFHALFLEASENDKLWSMLKILVQQFERFRITALSLPGRMASAVKQHEDIIDAFYNRDEELVEKLVRANAELSAEYLVKELSKELKELT